MQASALDRGEMNGQNAVTLFPLVGQGALKQDRVYMQRYVETIFESDRKKNFSGDSHSGSFSRYDEYEQGDRQGSRRGGKRT